MWRRTYLFLILVRLYFALSSSYLHPDENFQGPEVIAGEIFHYPVHKTWEFTSDYPIRSVFPLWPVYGLPMLLLRTIWTGNNGSNGEVAPVVVFWTLRVLMFTLSFVLEDWALHELLPSIRHRMAAMLLVASSYVTWTYQTHTFSNSIETLVVAWSLVLVQRILRAKKRSAGSAPAALAIFIVFGCFNRITFPAFLLIPCLRLIPHFLHRPRDLIPPMICALATAAVAIYLDTEFYSPEPVTLTRLLTNPTITPLNNLLYNLEPSNLAKHGLHPWYQHLLVNLPQLLGPAFLLLLLRPHFSLRLYSAISGIFVLSLSRHQEARFLLPTVPLILSSVKLPRRPAQLRLWVGVWVVFNLALGLLMGTYHQGGIVPTQVFLSEHVDAAHVLWWKTYSPPVWLLDGKNEGITTHDLMGMRGESMLEHLRQLTECAPSTPRAAADLATGTYLVAPGSATFLDAVVQPAHGGNASLHFEEVWRYRQHLNLDDLDFGDDGVWNTLERTVGRRGLVTWRVTKNCG